MGIREGVGEDSHSCAADQFHWLANGSQCGPSETAGDNTVEAGYSHLMRDLAKAGLI